MASNFLEILSQLHDHHVDFVIVGGVAAALHGRRAIRARLLNVGAVATSIFMNFMFYPLGCSIRSAF